MINSRNDLGTRGFGTASTIAAAVILAVTALLLATRGARAQQQPAPFELLGTVVDADQGQPVVGAWIGLAGSEWGSVSGDGGRFRISGVTAGPLSLTVEALGYETLRWEGEVRAGVQPLALELSPDPFLIEGLRVVSDRFRARRNAVATSVFAYDAADLASTAQRTALELVEMRSGAAAVPCAGRRGGTCLFLRGRAVEPTVYLDEVPVLGGLEYLDTFAPHELHMIEVFAGGRHIRAYTPRFMERAAKQRLSPIALLF